MDLAVAFFTLGGLFAAGLAADMLGRRTRLPRVTLLLACGLIVGEAGLGLLPEAVADWYEPLSIVALTMVAFLLGGALEGRTLAAHGREILSISLAIVLITLAGVTAGLWAMGVDPGLAFILGAIATATAPAAMQDVIRQSGIENGFTDTLKGITAIDDAWGLMVFAVVVVVVHQMGGSGEAGFLWGAVREIGGSILLGLAIGLPAAYLTGRLSDGEPLMTEALALVFFTAGAAIWLELSYLLAGMTVGAIIVNNARHHTRAFHEIEHIQWPFMILFFILAGAALEPDALFEVGVIGVAYFVLRILTRLVGGWIGAVLGSADAVERPWYGPALLPQAGVAVGMALVAGEQFPAWAEAIMALTIAATVAFELLGPFATLYAVRRVAAQQSSRASQPGQ